MLQDGGFWHDLPTFDWRSITSAIFGAALLWLGQLFKNKQSK